MTGDNCCIVGCYANKDRSNGLSFHSLPKKGVSKDKDIWREKLILIINRSDTGFNPDRARICSRHFQESCFIIKHSGKRLLSPGSMPTEFLPVKSVETPKPRSRKLPMMRTCTVTSSCQNQIDHSESHLCPGILDSYLQQYAALPPACPNLDGPKYFLHVNYQKQGDRFTSNSVIRAHLCEHYVSHFGQLCGPCSHSRLLVLKKHMRRKLSEKMTLRNNAPLGKVSKQRVANALKIQRMQEKIRTRQIRDIQDKLRIDSVSVSDKSHQRLKDIVECADKNSFVSLFWKEQKKAFDCKPGGMKWHPMMVRFAVLVHSQSPSTYRTLREIGVMKLPGESTLRDYTNVLHPHSGFSLDVFIELKGLADPLTENERWVCLLFDEVAIKADLVYDRVTGELVGFIDQEHETDKTGKNGHLATHALVFMVVGLTSNIKMSLGYFPTASTTANEMLPYLWEAIGLLENVCNLKVIACTSDKASQNQKLIRLCTDNGYKVPNLHALERNLYFFSDVPHLIKTVRNNLSSSGFGKNTKCLWNNGKELLWKHIAELYHKDVARELRMTKLTNEHIYLTPQSVMRVYLAAQVLSHSVGSILRNFGGPDKQELANFVLLMDKFFDCLNVRSTTEGKKRFNDFLAPYTSEDDPRFKFLQHDFIGYLESLKTSVDERVGFTKQEKKKMFLTDQTFQGLKTTVNSMVEATKYLLQSGVKMILSQKFCQDLLEEHFGRHRALGVRAENPTLWTYGYQENKLRMQRSLALCMLPKGNIRSKRQRQDIVVDNAPLPKIRRS